MDYEINIKPVESIDLSSPESTSSSNSSIVAEPAAMLTECYEDRLFKYLFDHNLIDSFGEVFDEATEKVSMPVLEREEIQRLLGILDEPSLLSHTQFPENAFIKADLDTLPKILNKYLKKNKIRESFSREICGGAVKYIFGISYFKRAFDQMNMGEWIDCLPSYMTQELGTKPVDVDQRLYAPFISSEQLNGVKNKTQNYFIKKIRQKELISKKCLIRINRECNFFSNYKLVKDSHTKDEFYIVSYGTPDSQAVDNLIIKQLGRKYLFANDSISLPVPSYVNYDEYKLSPRSLFHNGWQYLFSILTKRVVIAEPEKVNFSGWLKLISQFTKGYTTTHSTLEILFRNKLLEFKNNGALLQLITSTLKLHHQKESAAASVIFLSNAFVYLSHSLDQLTLSNIAQAVFSSFQSNESLDNPLLEQLQKLLISRHLPFNTSLALLTLMCNLKCMDLNENMAIVNRPLFDGTGIQIRFTKDDHLQTILLPNDRGLAWKTLTEFYTNNFSVEAANELNALWNACRNNFSYELLKEEAFLEKLPSDWNFESVKQAFNSDSQVLMEMGLTYHLLYLLKEKNLNCILEIYQLAPYLMKTSSRFQQDYFNLLCFVLETVTNKSLEINLVDAPLNLKVKIADLALQLSNSWIDKQVINEIHAETDSTIQEEFKALIPRITQIKKLDLISIKLEISKLFNQTLTNEQISIYERLVLESDFNKSHEWLPYFSTYTIQILNVIKLMPKKNKRLLNRQELATTIALFISKVPDHSMINLEEICISFVDVYLVSCLFKNKTPENEMFLKHILDHLNVASSKNHTTTIREIIKYFEQNQSLDKIKNFIEANPEFDVNGSVTNEIVSPANRHENIKLEIQQLTKKHALYDNFDKIKEYIQFLKNNRFEIINDEIDGFFKEFFRSINEKNFSKNELKSICDLLLNTNKLFLDLEIEYSIEIKFLKEIVNLLTLFDAKKNQEEFKGYYQLLEYLYKNAIHKKGNSHLKVVESSIIKISEDLNSKQNHIHAQTKNAFFDGLQSFVFTFYEKIPTDSLVKILNQLNIKNHATKDPKKITPILNQLICDLNDPNILHNNEALLCLYTLLNQQILAGLYNLEFASFFDLLFTAYTSQKHPKDVIRWVTLAFKVMQIQGLKQASFDLVKLSDFLIHTNQSKKLLELSCLFKGDRELTIQILKCCTKKFPLYISVAKELLDKDCTVFSDPHLYSVHHSLINKKLNEKEALHFDDLLFFFTNQLVFELNSWELLLSKMRKTFPLSTQQSIVDGYIEFDKGLIDNGTNFEQGQKLSCWKYMKAFIDELTTDSILKYYSMFDEFVNMNRDNLDQEEVIKVLQSLIMGYTNYTAKNEITDNLTEIQRLLKSDTYKLVSKSAKWNEDICIQFSMGYLFMNMQNKRFSEQGGCILTDLFENYELKTLSDFDIQRLNELILKLPMFVKEYNGSMLMIFDMLCVYIYKFGVRSKQVDINPLRFINISHKIKVGLNIDFVGKHYASVFNQIKYLLANGGVSQFIYEIKTFYDELVRLQKYREIEESLLHLNFDNTLRVCIIERYIQLRESTPYASYSAQETSLFANFCLNYLEKFQSEMLIYKMFLCVLNTSNHEDSMKYIQKIACKYLSLGLETQDCFETFLEMIFVEAKNKKNKLEKFLSDLRMALMHMRKRDLVHAEKIFQVEFIVIKKVLKELIKNYALHRGQKQKSAIIENDILEFNQILNEFAYNGFKYNNEKLCKLYRESAYALTEDYTKHTKNILFIAKELSMINFPKNKIELGLTSEEYKKTWELILSKVLNYHETYILSFLLDIIEQLSAEDPVWKEKIFTSIVKWVMLAPFNNGYVPSRTPSSELTRLELFFSYFNKPSKEIDEKNLFHYLDELLKACDEKKVVCVDISYNKHVVPEMIHCLSLNIDRIKLANNEALKKLCEIIMSLKKKCILNERETWYTPTAERLLSLMEKFSSKKFPLDAGKAHTFYLLMAKDLKLNLSTVEKLEGL